MVGSPKINLPIGWRLACPPNISYRKVGKEKELLVFSLVLHPKKNLPFFPIDISSVCSFLGNNDTDTITTKALGKVYFTPYRTTEIWSIEDYGLLNRVWHTHQSEIDTQRIFIHKAQIPKSDIPKDYQVKELWEEDRRLVFVKGLAYSIPLLAIHPDTLAAMYDREEINEYNPEDEPEAEIEIPSTINGRKRRVGGKVFDGTVSGRLVLNTLNDLGDPVRIPLSGIRVKLMEEDIRFNEEFGQTYTDANGNFSISYSQPQSFPEGKKIELFLVYHTYNGEYDLKVKKYAIGGPAFEEHTWLGDRGDDLNENKGDLATK